MTETNIRAATLADLRFVDDLRAREWEAVGFIPMSRYEAVVHGEGGRLFVAEQNDELCGFLYATTGFPLVSVTQIAVEEDARRVEIGRALMERLVEEATAVNRLGLRSRVAVDLEAHKFYQALGFEALCRHLGKSWWTRDSGPKSRVVTHYERLWQPRLGLAE